MGSDEASSKSSDGMRGGGGCLGSRLRRHAEPIGSTKRSHVIVQEKMELCMLGREDFLSDLGQVGLDKG